MEQNFLSYAKKKSFKVPTMKSGLTEIKLRGFGGQGVVMAVEILAAIMSKAGYEIQSFSQYGAERRGGQVESYLRISKGPIVNHSRIYEADYLVLTSKALFKEAQIIPNIKEGGTLFVNARRADTFSLSGRHVEVVTLDADSIAAHHGVILPSGMPVINTTIVGGLIALFPDVPFDLVKEVLKEKEIPAVEKNIAAAEEAYRYVKKPTKGFPIVQQEGGREALQQKENPVFRPGASPCEVECPAGVPVREIVTWVRQGKIHKALVALKAENPLPGISGRACFHPCETACNRNEFDEAVAINALERTVADRARNVVQVKKPRRTYGNHKKVAVIGSGPAGLSCAYFLQMMGHRVTVFEALPVAGGIPRVGIPCYRLPRDVVNQQIKNVIDTGIELRTGMEVERTLFEKIMATYDACFVATGAHQSTRLKIPGEESPGVMSGLEFLKRVALGEQATVRERVGVIGGGNTAVDAARTAKRLGAKEVSIIYRRSQEEMPAHKEEVAQAKEEGVSIEYLAAPVRIHGSGRRINHLECVQMALLDTHEREDGRREVRPIEGSTFTMNVEGVITAVGEGIHVPFLPDTIRKNGSLVKVDIFGRTSLRVLYAGGDVATVSRSIAHAIGSGKRAAIGIDLFFKGKDGAEKEYRSIAAYLSRNDTKDVPKIVSVSDLNLHYFRKASKTSSKMLSPETRAAHFNEVNGGLSKNEAIKEAERCFRCGTCVSCGNCYIFCPDIAVHFDESMALPTMSQDVCKACGICINECPHGVIEWGKG